MNQESNFEELDQHRKILMAAAAEIRSHKQDVEDDLSRITQSKMRFFLQSPKYSFDDKDELSGEGSAPNLPFSEFDIFEEIAFAVEAIYPSYVAPRIQLNSYLECQAVDVEWDVTKHSLSGDADRMSSGMRTISIEVHWSAVMLAIKGALDRLIRVLHFFYPGFPAHTTWGRYAKDKPRGFMSVVHEGKDSDTLLAYFDNAYTDWIAAAVAPRDSLTHYHDPYSSWHLQDGHALVSVQHVKDNDSLGAYTLKTETLVYLVQRWYELADRTFTELAARQPRLPRKRSE